MHWQIISMTVAGITQRKEVPESYEVLVEMIMEITGLCKDTIEEQLSNCLEFAEILCKINKEAS